jgi:hypothetical protein
VEVIVDRIHAQGGIAIAPHPHRGALDGTQQLMYLWNNHEWKTIVGCDKNVEAVKQALRKNDAVSIYLFREGKVL